MSARKYGRLFAVCVIPLLILGAILSTIFYPAERYSAILCDGSYISRDNCRYVGDTEDPLYNYVKSTQELWFSIDWKPYNENSFHTVFVEATSRTINEVQIIGANTYFGQGPESERIINSLIGKPIRALHLGFNTGDKSYISDDFAILTCHTLSIHKEPTTYSAACFGNGWAGILKFEAFGESERALSSLRTQVEAERQARYLDTALYYIIFWPLFVYLFLFGSLIAFLARRAIRFVNAG